MNQDMRSPATEIVDAEVELDRFTVCRACNLSSEMLIEWVEAGVLEPRDPERREWRFSAAQLYRARAARRLQRDLELQTASLPVVLDLLEEVHQLRRQVRTLERLLDD
jgi:chaperone modulatory protein CbpM